MKRRWIYTTVCLAALAVVFISWWNKTPPASLPAAFSCLIATALFALLGIRFIPRWIESWSGYEDKSNGEEKTSFKTYLKIFGIFLLTRVVILALSMLFDLAVRGIKDPYVSFYNIWTGSDACHYIDIAENWYRSTGSIDGIVRLVFLPFFPILIRGLGYFTKNYFISGIVLSQVFFSLAGCVFYKLARFDFDHRGAMRALRYLAILPGGIFYAAPMSDSLFLLLSISCIYFTRRKDYMIAAIFGGLAAFTRSLGLTLLAPVMFELISDTIYEVKSKNFSPARAIIHFISLLIIPLGFSFYLLINYRISGNPFQYTIYLKEHWDQSFGLFFSTVSYQTHYSFSALFNGRAYWSWGLWWPNLIAIFSSLIIMVYYVKKQRPSYTAYYFAYFIISIGATWLLSAPRYLASMFPISLALTELSNTKRLDRIMTVALLFGTIYYLWAYVSGWCVY